MEPEPLEVDVDALLDAIDVLTDKPGVPAGLVERAEAKAAEAEEAVQRLRDERRAAATAAIEALAAKPVSYTHLTLPTICSV